MIKNLLILLLFVNLKTIGQENHSFIIVNNQLEWQKVFESKLSIGDIENILKTNGIFKHIESNNGQISGEIENITADYQGAGKTSWNTSFYVQNSSINGTFFLEFKNERYRVTLNGINLKTINDLSGNGISVMSANSVEPLSDFAIRKGNFRKGFLKADVETFEITFSNLFDFERYKVKSDEW